ncbi:NAD(P)H-binding protein [Streptomyces sp. SID11385]|uniref:NAD(P)H-binding protein n=1 Tax=Streptomyces sp. SID11385 TaxID=2706031 RepID=UPI0013C8191A|nr:NAD(P)H-binding protein [Streptomyces sp. SID11385]NEA40193.1 NAD(P)H-binding protein [Streptomyces sp. SID11385]
MSVVIAGGHGRVALMVSRLLAERGERVASVIRRREQAEAVRCSGARPLVADLATATARDLTGHLTGAQAVLYAAGAGLGDAPGRPNPVDYDGIVVFADAAERAGVRRFVMLSVMGADPAKRYPDNALVETFLRARGRADENVLARHTLSTTVVRPAWFRDRPGTGTVSLAARTGEGDIAREDVAAVLTALLTTDATSPRVLELITGPTPIPEAVTQHVRSRLATG